MEDLKEIVEEMKDWIYGRFAHIVATIEFWCVVYIPVFTTAYWPWLQ
jgi:hypothetical protein